jgi:hypothetical protein
MKRNLVLTTLMLIGLVLYGGAAFAGPRQLSPSRTAGGLSRGRTVERFWRPAPRIVSPYPGYFYYYPPYYPFYPNNPRSIVIITPGSYYPYTAVTSDPYYCYQHNVGFISRAGFLDHVSGSHDVPLETANAICAEGYPSCIIEGY